MAGELVQYVDKVTAGELLFNCIDGIHLLVPHLTYPDSDVRH